MSYSVYHLTKSYLGTAATAALYATDLTRKRARSEALAIGSQDQRRSFPPLMILLTPHIISPDIYLLTSKNCSFQPQFCLRDSPWPTPLQQPVWLMQTKSRLPPGDPENNHMRKKRPPSSGVISMLSLCPPNNLIQMFIELRFSLLGTVYTAA